MGAGFWQVENGTVPTRPGVGESRLSQETVVCLGWLQGQEEAAEGQEAPERERTGP